MAYRDAYEAEHLLAFPQERALTAVEVAGPVWPAAPCWQKHYLQLHQYLLSGLLIRTIGQIIESSPAARLNGYLSGRGTLQQLAAELAQLPLSDVHKRELVEIVGAQQDLARPAPSALSGSAKATSTKATSAKATSAKATSVSVFTFGPPSHTLTPPRTPLPRPLPALRRARSLSAPDRALQFAATLRTSTGTGTGTGLGPGLGRDFAQDEDVSASPFRPRNTRVAQPCPDARRRKLASSGGLSGRCAAVCMPTRAVHVTVPIPTRVSRTARASRSGGRIMHDSFPHLRMARALAGDLDSAVQPDAMFSKTVLEEGD